MTKMMRARVLRPSRGVALSKTEAQDLETIIKDCVRTEASWGLMQNDLMFAVAFWTLVECGFESQSTSLPKNWKHETRPLYEANFLLPPYEEHPVKLIALPADDILCINILVANISPRNISLRSLAIHSTGYVPRPEEDTIRYKFSGLENFYILLREALIWPIRCSILTEQGVMNGSLCGLSDEIKLKIVRHLSVKEVLMLSQTCHDLNRICNDQELWKSIFHEEFKSSCRCATDSQDCDETPDWKESFKRKYVERRTKGDSARESPSDSFHTALEAPYGSEITFDID